MWMAVGDQDALQVREMSSGQRFALLCASLQAAEPPKRATPKVLETMRRSRMWRLVTTGVNYDIHKVRWLAVQQLPACRRGVLRPAVACIGVHLHRSCPRW